MFFNDSGVVYPIYCLLASAGAWLVLNAWPVCCQVCSRCCIPSERLWRADHAGCAPAPISATTGELWTPTAFISSESGTTPYPAPRHHTFRLQRQSCKNQSEIHLRCPRHFSLMVSTKENQNIALGETLEIKKHVRPQFWFKGQKKK